MRRFIVVSLLFLNACASVPPPAQQPPAALPLPAEPIRSTVLQTFGLQGRVSVQYDEQSMSGQIHWQASVESDEVLLSSPLGQGMASISRNSNGVILARPGEPMLAAENVEALTQKALGFRLPLSGLRYWIQAIPDPTSESKVRLNAQGVVEQIAQDGWKIDYLQYAENRPRKIHVVREGLEIRLVIDAWQTN